MTYGTLGLEMGLSVAIGIGIGYFLDSRFNTKPILSIVFLMFGVAAGMKRLYASGRRLKRKMKDATITEIERINLMILLVGSVASIFIMREFKYFFSFAVASAMMTANFRLIRKILTAAFSAATIQKRELVKLPLKFIALAVLFSSGDDLR